MYSGPKKPDSEVATIKFGGARLLRLDGSAPGSFAGGMTNEFKVLPGVHTLTLSYEVNPRYGSPITVSVSVEAGKTYLTQAFLNGNSWTAGVVEESSGRSVVR